jgi:hypothetical protein
MLGMLQATQNPPPPPLQRTSIIKLICLACEKGARFCYFVWVCAKAWATCCSLLAAVGGARGGRRGRAAGVS